MQDRSKEAIKVYDQVGARSGTDSTPTVREVVAMALVLKGNVLGQLGAASGGDVAAATSPCGSPVQAGEFRANPA